MIYAGIGSRETPEDVLSVFRDIGRELANQGHTLRSGFAGGADMAFARGANSSNLREPSVMEMYIPWAGFNGAPRNDPWFIVPEFTPELIALAAKHHPAWHRCSPGAQKLHARNGCQILGKHLDKPVDFVICWTKGGLGGGGTGQAIRIAQANNIPVYDFGHPVEVSLQDRKISLMQLYRIKEPTT